MSLELSPELIKEFVTVSHFNFARVQELLSAHPALVNVGHDWGNGDVETGVMAAGHVGNRAIAEYLLEHGAPLNICVAAMLGQKDAVQQFLTGDSSLANVKGAHGIPLMFHVAMSGDTQLAQIILDYGGGEGRSFALVGAVNHQHANMVRWLLDNGANPVGVVDYQNKTVLQLAEEANLSEIAALLREHGAT